MAEDLLEIVEEAVLEQTVGLVQHQELDLLRADLNSRKNNLSALRLRSYPSLTEEVLQSTGRSAQDVATASNLHEVGADLVLAVGLRNGHAGA